MTRCNTASIGWRHRRKFSLLFVFNQDFPYQLPPRSRAGFGRARGIFG
jgi:hypothetical protein